MSIQQLYLCEKPSQGRDIASVLGCKDKGDGCLKNASGTVVTWCFGHLLETATPEHYCENLKPWRMAVLPVVPKSWHMKVREDAKKQFAIISKLLKQTPSVIIATDADREGEVIAREILELCEYRGSLKRLWLSALDEASIKKALSEMREAKTTEGLYYAGLGRQRADWLIGMNMTMAISALFGKRGEGVLSVGRVQTPTLKLVVDRDQVIDHFKPQNYYEIFMRFKDDKEQTFIARWQPPERDCDENGHFINQQLIHSFFSKTHGKKGHIEEFTEQQKKQGAPLCLSLSALQKLASAKYGFSAKETLNTVQALYETHKAVTYPRTDCGYMPENQFAEASPILANLLKVYPELAPLIDQCNIHFKSSVWNDKKITAHHAIVPTQNAKVNLEAMSVTEKKIYDLICRYYLAQFMGDYQYAQRSVKVLCMGEPFKASSSTPLVAGWKTALSQLSDDDKDEDALEEQQAIPLLTQGDQVVAAEGKIATKQTRPPARFTEGTLIDAMKSISKYVTDERHKKVLKETAGIGTEATRAAILENLFKRGYLLKKGKQIMAADKGKNLIQLLPPIVCDPVLTALWEQQLDNISEGKGSLNEFIHEQKSLLNMMLTAIQKIETPDAGRSIEAKDSNKTTENNTRKNTGNVCPQCQKPLKRRKSSKDDSYFFGCSGYPECRFTAKDNNGVPEV